MEQISDQGKVTTVSGKKMLTFLVIDHPIIASYRQVLIDLGKECIKARLAAEKARSKDQKSKLNEIYQELSSELNRYETIIRENQGYVYTRPLVPLNMDSGLYSIAT